MICTASKYTAMHYIPMQKYIARLMCATPESRIVGHNCVLQHCIEIQCIALQTAGTVALQQAELHSMCDSSTGYHS